jgi:hypothetical protein
VWLSKEPALSSASRGDLLGAVAQRSGLYEDRQCGRFDVTRGAARAAHAHQKLTEAVVELLDVGQRLSVRTGASLCPTAGSVHAVLTELHDCMETPPGLHLGRDTAKAWNESDSA